MPLHNILQYSIDELQNFQMLPMPNIIITPIDRHNCDIN